MDVVDWIREQVAPILSVKATPVTIPGSVTEPDPDDATVRKKLFEADFPPLSSTSMNGGMRAGNPRPPPPPRGRTEKKSATKEKRRIRTVLVEKPTDVGDISKIPDSAMAPPSGQIKDLLVKRERSNSEHGSSPFATCTPRKDDPAGHGNLLGSGQRRASVLWSPPLVPSTPPSRPISEEKRTRLLEISRTYSDLIMQKMVPRVDLEISFLFRLLLVDVNASLQGDQQNTNLFSTGQACNVFAACTLNLCKCLVLLLGDELLVKLQTHKVLITECPSLVSAIKDRVEENNRREVCEEKRRLDGDTTLLGRAGFTDDNVSLPFREETDARYHFQSVDMAIAYKNREEQRDFFLQHFRDFQQATLAFDPSKLKAGKESTYMTNFKPRSQQIMGRLLPYNFPWFVDFFVDTLLRVAYASDEADQDVVMMEHFSRRPSKLALLSQRVLGNEGRSSTQVKQRRVPTTDSPVESSSPEDSFSGNQQFFFFYLRSIDSLTFGALLRDRIQATIINTMEEVTSENFTASLMKLKVLAKFMGVVTFSPRWPSSECQTFASHSSAWRTLLQEQVRGLDLLLPSFPLLTYLQHGWTEKRLSVTVPLACEYLRMMRWDLISRSTQYMRKVMSLLRAIYLSPRMLIREESSTTTLFLNLELEQLFEDFPIPKTQLEALEGLPRRSSSLLPLDDLPLSLSSQFTRFCCPLLYEVQMILRTVHRASTSAFSNIRKVRPFTYGISPESSSGQKPDSHEEEEPAASDTLSMKLERAFFHIHPSLHKTTEFVATTCQRNGGLMAIEQCLPSLIKKTIEAILKQQEPGEAVMMQTKMELKASIEIFVEEYCQSNIPKAMKALLPPSTPQAVGDMVIHLAIKFASSSGATDKVVDTALSTLRKQVGEAVVSASRPAKPPATPDPTYDTDSKLIALKALLEVMSRSIEDRNHECCAQLEVDLVPQLQSVLALLQPPPHPYPCDALTTLVRSMWLSFISLLSSICRSLEGPSQVWSKECSKIFLAVLPLFLEVFAALNQHAEYKHMSNDCQRLLKTPFLERAAVAVVRERKAGGGNANVSVGSVDIIEDRGSQEKYSVGVKALVVDALTPEAADLENLCNLIEHLIHCCIGLREMDV